MAISFQCSQCGRSYTTTEQWAGKNVKCKQCGQTVKIPPAPAASQALPPADVYGLDELDDGAKGQPASASALPPRAAEGKGAFSPNPKAKQSKRPKAAEKSSGSKGLFGGVGGAIFLVVIIGARVYFRYNRDQARRVQQGDPAQLAAQLKNLPPLVSVPQAYQTPWTMPALPELPPGVELQPGVMFHEMHLPGSSGPGGAVPAHAGKLWVYLPSGEHAPKSLGCILTAGAGSNLITGMDLGDGDRPEHLPYVQAGFAVVAYELDGKAPETANANGLAVMPYVRAFLNAEAGLLNARVAIEYALTRVAAIDPRRLYAAGHSSAGTLALLVAENESRLAGCLAYAPAVDLTIQYQRTAQEVFAKLVPGSDQLFTRFNPRTNEAKIQCPLFLFYAEDDARFAKQVRDLAERMKAEGKSVTLSFAPTGGHYDSMIQSGIPRGIDWLKSL